ncbi:MAG: DHH family phosphoesterase [DPANN group archaeon]|nr:DHH family phosphoesterase [DPANN group archaeon]
MIHQKIEDISKLAAKKIIDEKGKILIVSHFDADGICAGSLAYKALGNIGKKCDIQFIKQLELDILKEIAKVDADLFWFTDLGSGQINNINKYIKGKKIIITDHHNIDNTKSENNENDIIHINPHLVDIDGTDEISGAGTTYILASKISKDIDEFIYLALAGAVGDIQKKNGIFKSLNKKILKKAIKLKRINANKGLRLFGRSSKPLHKCLQYCREPKIPKIADNEMKAIKFIKNLNIPIKQTNGEWTRLIDLDKKQETELSTAILLAANVTSNETHIIGCVYILPNNFEIREFATMLNACGRMGKSEEGMKLCLNMRNSIDDILIDYKRKIAESLTWASQNKDAITKTDIASYLIAKNNIDDNFIGTVISIQSYSKTDRYILIGLADSDNGIKVSGRVSDNLKNKINLGAALKKVSEELKGEGGGHNLAGGAKIPKGSEERFIKLLDNLLKEQLNNNSS